MWKDLDLEQMAQEECSYAPPRSPEEIEQIVVFVRDELHNRGRPCGAAALRSRLDEFYHLRPLPSMRTLVRILGRQGRERKEVRDPWPT